MAFPPHVWRQIKNLTADDLIAALKRDGFTADGSSGAIHAYIRRHSAPCRVTIHYHPKKTYGPKLLQGLLADIGWTDNDLRRLKLIK